jgi:pyridoxamine 5'-phosphate oxidase
VAATCGRPRRIVLIKGYDARGIVWYTNYDSRKGQELAGNPYAALQFHWVELERVVRIEGRVEKVAQPRATPTSPAARSTRASAPGPARRAR